MVLCECVSGGSDADECVSGGSDCGKCVSGGSGGSDGVSGESDGGVSSGSDGREYVTLNLPPPPKIKKMSLSE